MTTTTVVGAALVSHGRLLAARRAYPAEAAGRWELPGGKARPGEDPVDAVRREVHEELGCSVEVTGTLPGRSRIDAGLELVVHLAAVVDGEPVPAEHDAIRWLGPEELDEVDWLPADVPFLAGLRALLAEGERLAGGNVGGAVRIGRSVRRATGPWTDSVHALLGHLERAGLPAVPRVLGTDDSGREVLTHLPGRIVDVDHEVVSEAALVDAMRWLRRYHDAVGDFRLAGPWRTGSRELTPDEIICHHDFAPYNVALSSSADGERVVGVFDWDMAGPGTRLQDLGFAAWSWVPLFRPRPTEEVAARLRAMSAGYGEITAAEILAAVAPRVQRSIRVIAAGQRAGDPGFVNLGTVGEPARTQGRLDALRARIPAIEEVLTR